MNKIETLSLDACAAERQLGGVLLSGASFAGVSWVGETQATGLRTGDFLWPDYRSIWEACQFVHDGGDAPNWVVVTMCLREAGFFYTGWTEHDVVRLTTETLAPSVHVAEALARAVHRYAVERRERKQILSTATTALAGVGEKPHWRSQYEEA